MLHLRFQARALPSFSSLRLLTRMFPRYVLQGGQAPSSDMAAFRKDFDKAKHIIILTGAGVSAESGVPTFRGAGGYWRKWQAQELATPDAFEEKPSRVWEFYHYRREVMASKHPNKAHIAIAECEKRLKDQGRRVVVITQNIDELHKRAGSNNILELHGNLFTTRCTKCKDITKNYDSPTCEALRDKGEPAQDVTDANIPDEDLPRCKKEGCGAMTRPHVVWFGEGLDPYVMEQVDGELKACDLCLVVGTSSVVYPAAMFAPTVAARGVPVAEFNTEATSVTTSFGYHFQGPCGTTIPEALAPTESEPKTEVTGGKEAKSGPSGGKEAKSSPSGGKEAKSGSPGAKETKSGPSGAKETKSSPSGAKEANSGSSGGKKKKSSPSSRK